MAGEAFYLLVGFAVEDLDGVVAEAGDDGKGEFLIFFCPEIPISLIIICREYLSSSFVFKFIFFQ